MKIIDLTGQRFGRLLVLERGENDRDGKARWICRCDCGATSSVMRGNLRNGGTTSCGCWSREQSALRAPNLSHGHARGGRPTTEYATWCSMIQRCYYPKHSSFKNYGGRGISVCARWRDSFEHFLSDMGPKPSPALTLDRIDNDLGYFPGNCTWATRKQQRANQRIPHKERTS